MKKLAIIAIGMAAVMMACTNKGKTAPGDGSDSDSVANDSLLAEQPDTTPRPMLIWMQGGKNMQMLYWANIAELKKDENNAEYFDEMMASWTLQDGFRRNRAMYTKLIGENNKCLGIKYTGEVLKDPDGNDASYGEIHGREEIPAAGLKYEFTDKKFNAREMGGMYVAVTDEYLATRKLIDMRMLDGVKPLPAKVVKQLEGEYKMKAECSRLAKQGKLLTHHTDHAVLTLMNLDSVIERDYLGVDPDMELNQIVNKISRSHSTVLPVLDAGGKLLGEIDIMKIRNVVFRIELYHHFKASQLMTDPKAILNDGMPMRQVMRAFDRTGANWLPVLDTENRLKGYISRQRIYTMYRKMVADMSED